VGDAVSVFQNFGIVLPRSTTTLFRTLATLTGTLKVISPDYDLSAGIKRVGGEAVASHLIPTSLQDFAQAPGARRRYAHRGWLDLDPG
jgi:ubiquinone biosynthesis protein